MDIKVIVLDFDGVIVESNNIKHQAFSELFQDYPEYYDKIMAYHLTHNAVNRHDRPSLIFAGKISLFAEVSSEIFFEISFESGLIS